MNTRTYRLKDTFGYHDRKGLGEGEWVSEYGDK